jgi:hypothetical protein
MNQDDLTEEGMRQGVKDSDLFIFFLTNSVLSRTFCIKELGWASACLRGCMCNVLTLSNFLG